MTFLDKGTVLV